MNSTPGVARVWRGWTTVENADAYEAILLGEVFPSVLERRIPGLVRTECTRADDVLDDEVELVTIIRFEDLDSLKGFVGEDYRRPYVPDNAKAVLKRFEPEAKHFHLAGEFA